MKFHRLIIDECHSADVGKHIDLLQFFNVHYLWGVTGTPLSSSVADLETLARLLGHWDRASGLQLSEYAHHDADRSKLPAVLQKVMIRHTKSQRIAGHVALALPATDCQTVWLDMSAAERSLYSQASCVPYHRRYVPQPYVQTFGVENALRERRRVCSGVGLSATRTVRGMALPSRQSVKLTVLLDDLNALRSSQPSLHAVVFTHHTAAYKTVTKALGCA